MTLKRYAATAVAVATAFSLAACSSGSGSGASGVKLEKGQLGPNDFLDAKYDDLKEGGELTLSLGELVEQLAPGHADASTDQSVILGWYTPNAVFITRDLQIEPVADYIKDWKEEDKDGKSVVTLNLNEKAKWNDDTPIDWKSYAALKTIYGKIDGDYKIGSDDGFKYITSIERGDNDFQVIVKFDRRYPFWKSLFSPVHPKTADPKVFNEGFIKNAHPEWGAGPYKLDKIDYNQGYVTFVPNEKWWGKKGKLNKVTYKVLDADATLNAFKNGEVDAVGASSKQSIARIGDMPDTTAFKATAFANSLLMLNSKSDVLKEAKVREAIFSAIDRKQLQKIRFEGVGYEETPPGSFIAFPFQTFYEDNFSKAVTYDQEKAKQILEEDGWKAGADGIREKNGKKLEIRFPAIGDSDLAKAIPLAVQKMLKDVGVDVKIENRPSSDFVKIYTKRDFDIFSLGFKSNDVYGVAYFGQTYGSDSTLNLSGTGSKEFDKKIEELRKLGTVEELYKRGNELEVEAFKTFGIMPLWNGPSRVVTKKGLAGVGAMGVTKPPKELIGWVK